MVSMLVCMFKGTNSDTLSLPVSHINYKLCTGMLACTCCMPVALLDKSVFTYILPFVEVDLSPVNNLHLLHHVLA